jgi:hypothetical protein
MTLSTHAVPTTSLISGLRINAGLTQQQAAEMVHLGSFKRWSEYERGITTIDMARWELFLIKCGRHELYKPVKGVPVPTAEKQVRSVTEAVQAVTRAPQPLRTRNPRPGPSNRP